MSASLVTVCVVTHNSAADLPDCLASVAAQDHRPLELVIVDCASADDSLAVARSTGVGDVAKSVFALGANLGFAGGMNEAFRRASAAYLLTLNPDARMQPSYVSRLLDRARRTDTWRVGAVTGRLLRPSTSHPRRLDACGMRLTRAWRHFDRGSGEIDRGQWSRPERVFGATGAASLFVREALDDVSLAGEAFDPMFHSYREDAELCFRLRERGWEVLYEPAAQTEHRRRVVPAARRRLPKEINFHSLKNRYLIRAYHQTPANLVRTLLPCLIRDLMALAWVLSVERSSLAAYAWLWRHRDRILARRRYIQERRTQPVDAWFSRVSLPL